MLAYGTLDGFGAARRVLGDAQLKLERAAPPPWEAEDVVALLVDPEGPVEDRDIAGLPNLAVVATASVGTDHLDLDAARTRGVVIRRVSDYCTVEVATHTLAMVLCLLRALPELDRRVRAGDWPRADTFLGAPPDSPMGLVGFGAIGREVARMAGGLGFPVLATDPTWPEAAARDAGVRLVGLDELLAQSAIVSLHAPLSSDTLDLIGERELARMPRGSMLVNTSRGRLVDMVALTAALDAGQLAAAALDVFPEEPPSQAVLHPRILASPHVAWYSARSAGAAYAQAAHEIADEVRVRHSSSTGASGATGP